MFFNNWDKLKLKLKLHIWLKRQRRSHMTCNAPPYRCRVFKSNFCFRFEHSKCCLVPFCWREGGHFVCLVNIHIFLCRRRTKETSNIGMVVILKVMRSGWLCRVFWRMFVFGGHERKAQMKRKRDICIQIYDRGVAGVLTRPSSVCPSQI